MPTKDEIETELNTLKEEYSKVLGENQAMKDAGAMDLTSHIEKAKQLEADKTKLEMEIKLMKESARERERELAIRDEDVKKKEEQEKLPFQTEHTRFRLLPGPYQRDIFGNVGVPVFDLGVTLDFYSGHVDIPLNVVVEMAQSIGMLTTEQAEELKLELKVEKAKNEAAGNLGNILVDGIHSLIGDFNVNLDSVGVASREAELAETNVGNKDAEDAGQSSGDDAGKESGGVPDDNADSVGGGNEGNDGGDSKSKLDAILDEGFEL